jgi:tetratricopeptide (TPR) repeat protein
MERMKRAFAALLLLAAGCAARNAQERFEEGNRLYDAGDADGAARAYGEAIEADPGLARAWNNRGLAKSLRGELAGALADYGEALRLGATAEAHYNRGVAYLRAEDAYRAVADFSDALRLQPEYPRALAGRGLARAKVGDKTGAAVDFKKALELSSPDWPERPRVEAELAKLSGK